jgi:hypothetical protein
MDMPGTKNIPEHNNRKRMGCNRILRSPGPKYGNRFYFDDMCYDWASRQNQTQTVTK